MLLKTLDGRWLLLLLFKKFQLSITLDSFLDTDTSESSLDLFVYEEEYRYLEKIADDASRELIINRLEKWSLVLNSIAYSNSSGSNFK